MRDYFISVWGFFDPFYYYITRLTLPTTKEGNIFRVRLTKYRGRKLVLSDGTKINKNDLLIKIHLHNIKLIKEFKNVNSDLKKARLIYHYVQRSLPEIDLYIQNHSCSHKIKGIIGITALNKGSDRLGFEVFDISSPVYKWFKKFAHLPIGILTCHNASVWSILKTHKPCYLIMSNEKLSNLYRH